MWCLLIWLLITGLLSLPSERPLLLSKRLQSSSFLIGLGDSCGADGAVSWTCNRRPPYLLDVEVGDGLSCVVSLDWAVGAISVVLELDCLSVCLWILTAIKVEHHVYSPPPLFRWKNSAFVWKPEFWNQETLTFEIWLEKPGLLLVAF